MKVLHCIPSMSPGDGGPTRALIGLCGALHRTAPATSITIATTSFGMTAAWRSTLERSLPRNVELLVFDQRGAHTTNFSSALVRWCQQAVRRFDVVEIHALFHPMSTVVAWICARRRVPYIIRPLGTLSAYTFDHRRTLAKKTYYRLFDRSLIGRAACLHFTTEAEAAKAARLGLSVPYRVIPLPVEASTSREPRSPIRDRLLFLGRLHPVKGLDILLPAFRKVLESRPAARLVIAGGGDPAYEQALREDVAKLGLAESVDFTGFVDDRGKQELFNVASVMTLPSHQESFGLAMAEGMAAGLPVVITTGSDLSSDIERAGAGLVTPPDVSTFARAVLTLLSDDLLRERLGLHAAELVRRRFSVEQVGAELLSMYSDAAREKRHAPAGVA